LPSWRHITYSNEIENEHFGKSVTVGGWAQEIRNLGGISFLQLRDRFGVIQITTLKKKDPELFSRATSIQRESVLMVTGTVKESKEARAGFEIIPENVTVLSEAHTPLPLGVVDKVGADLDTRLNNRFMDLRKPDIRAIFQIRAVPKIVAAGAEGGATLFPIKYFDKSAYLAQSPQLYKQNLMATGLDRIFEISPAYRAEASDTVRHIAEFTSLDIELAFIESSEDVMAVAEGIAHNGLRHVKEVAGEQLGILGVDVSVPETPFPRITYSEAIDLLKGGGMKVEHGEDLGTEGEKLLGAIMMKERGCELYFITDYFDLDYRGQEIVSGGQREHRYDVLVEQMTENNLNLDSFEFYLKAFRFGMPPHGGFGFGIERFVQKMLGLANIREAVLYPRDRLRLTP
jgi:nondiscriminating aspartyl-tRNA synthetase